MDFNFDADLFQSLIGGRSVLHMQKLRTKTLDQAEAFLKAYGYDLSMAEDRERAWAIHARAVAYVESQLLLGTDKELPLQLKQPERLGHLGQLLLAASDDSLENRELARWACGLLRVMHVVSHVQNDLFSYFYSEIQEEIFKPYEKHVHRDEKGGLTLGTGQDAIALQSFDLKPFKYTDSTITKFLAKPDAVAFGVLDKVGLRFVTKNLFDCFRLMRFLVQHSVVSFPHLVPDQSNNTLYPVNLFMEVVESFQNQNATVEEVDEALKTKLKEHSERAEFVLKHNPFSGSDYRFIKFITRRLIRVPMRDGRSFTFFYPYEVQIMDGETFKGQIEGPSSHKEYKDRQRAMARSRVFGEGF